MIDQVPERVANLTEAYTTLVHYGGRSDEAEALLCAIERDWAAEVPRLLTLCHRAAEMLEYMEDRGFSSQRLLASDIEEMFRTFPAHLTTDALPPPPGDADESRVASLRSAWTAIVPAGPVEHQTGWQRAKPDVMYLLGLAEECLYRRRVAPHE